MPEVFDFGENLDSDGGYQVAKYKPQPGQAIVEIYDAAGRMLGMDVFAASSPAPVAPALKPIIATDVTVGATSLRHIEFEQPLNDGPVELPLHLREKSKIGAVSAKVWWSCE